MHLASKKKLASLLDKQTSYFINVFNVIYLREQIRFSHEYADHILNAFVIMFSWKHYQFHPNIDRFHTNIPN